MKKHWIHNKNTILKSPKELYNHIISLYEDDLKLYTKHYYGIDGQIDFSTLENNFIESIEQNIEYEEFLDAFGYQCISNALEHLIENCLYAQAEPYWSGWTVRQITNMIRNNFNKIKELYESETIHS